MADKSIDDLTQATSVTDSDKFLLQQNGIAKSLQGSLLRNYAENAGAEAGSQSGASAGEAAGKEAGEISGRTAGSEAGSESGKTAGAESGAEAGAKAGKEAAASLQRGYRGFSIKEVSLESGTHAPGELDTYNVVYYDPENVESPPETTTFQVYNGMNGAGTVASVNGDDGPDVILKTSNIENDSGYITSTALVDLIYPVGSFYMTELPPEKLDPNTYFGGVWERIKDVFLLAGGDTFSPGSTGGEATTNIEIAGTVSSHTLTEKEIPSHRHGVDLSTGEAGGHRHYIYFNEQEEAGVHTWDAAGSGGGITALTSSDQYGDNLAADYVTDHKHSVSGNTGYVGSGEGHNHEFVGAKLNPTNMPPYVSVYTWKRTK